MQMFVAVERIAVMTCNLSIVDVLSNLSQKQLRRAVSWSNLIYPPEGICVFPAFWMCALDAPVRLNRPECPKHTPFLRLKMYRIYVEVLELYYVLSK